MKKHTKILNLGALLLFACSWQLSAQDCSFSKNETDKFTNSRILHTKPVNVISEKVKLKNVYTIDKIEMQAKYENNNYSLSLIYYFALGQSITNSDHNLILLLNDGSTIEAPCLQNIPSVRVKGVGIAVYTYDFGISETNFVKLLESDITDIRMNAAINPVEFSIDKKVKTREFFKCIDRNK